MARDYLTEWNEQGLTPVNKEDRVAIEDAELNEIELYYDDFFRVYNEGGIYIADLKRIV